MSAETHELLGLRYGQVAQHEPIKQRENRSVRSNSQSKRDNRDCGKAWRLAQHADTEADILKEGFNQVRSYRVADFFFGPLIRAKSDARAAFGLRAGKTGTLQIVSTVLNVRLQLLVHLTFNARLMKE